MNADEINNLRRRLIWLGRQLVQIEGDKIMHRGAPVQVAEDLAIGGEVLVGTRQFLLYGYADNNHKEHFVGKLPGAVGLWNIDVEMGETTLITSSNLTLTYTIGTDRVTLREILGELANASHNVTKLEQWATRVVTEVLLTHSLVGLIKLDADLADEALRELTQTGSSIEPELHARNVAALTVSIDRAKTGKAEFLAAIAATVSYILRRRVMFYQNHPGE